eukprot:Hpha_TRINITY_DN8440_c0_g1::TRINITY_DN8440_c0_g1_i1::g.34607::m.34607
MTTVEREHAFTLFCQGKSNRTLYTDACSTMGIRRNGDLTESFSERPDAFELRKLDLSTNYLGAEGVRALFHLIQANRALVHVGLQCQGVDDACLAELVGLLRQHPRVTSVDLSQNADITHASSPHLLSLVNDNKMISELHLEGTGVPSAVQRHLVRKATDNFNIECAFFKGDYCRMKRLFLQLDSDGSGRITTAELLANIDIPQVANTLLNRFDTMDWPDADKPRDRQISINEFLFFTHPGFKTRKDIEDHMQRRDEQEDNVKKNLELIREALTKCRLTAPDYRRLKISDRILTDFEVNRLVDFAMQAESAANEDGAAVRGGKIVISFMSLKKAIMQLRKSTGNVKDANSAHGFKMSPTLIRLAQRGFDEKARLLDPSKRQGGSGETEVEAETLLSLDEKKGTMLQTNCVRLHLKTLKSVFSGAGVPLTSPMTLEEWITCLDEYYDVIKYGLFK